jgi:hypothetical protein
MESSHHMANKKEAQEPPEGVLIAAAKGIGAAAGTIAAAMGIGGPQKPEVAKLVIKKKTRLPRRQKKAAKQAATRAKRKTRVKTAI